MSILQDIITTYLDLSDSTFIYNDIVTKNIETVTNLSDIDIRMIEDTYGRTFVTNLLTEEQLDWFESQGLLSAEVVTSLRTLNITMESKWSQLTDDADPTLEQVEEAIQNEIVIRQQHSWIDYVKNGILSNYGSGKSIGELKALINEYGG